MASRYTGWFVCTGLSIRATGRQTTGMDGSAPSYKGYRFPPEIISHAVWLYDRFSLSFRGVKDLLAQWDIVVSYETITPMA